MSKLEIKPKRFEVIDVNDPKCQFRINIDVLNECLGLNRGMYMNASYPKSGPGGKDWIPGLAKGEKFFVWMPKLYSNSSEWRNSISEDGTRISEIAEPAKVGDYLYSYGDIDPAFSVKRVVFVKGSPKDPYRFVGVFVAEEYCYQKHVFKRIATKVKLIGNPVTQIEIVE